MKVNAAQYLNSDSYDIWLTNDVAHERKSLEGEYLERHYDARLTELAAQFVADTEYKLLTMNDIIDYLNRSDKLLAIQWREDLHCLHLLSEKELKKTMQRFTMTYVEVAKTLIDLNYVEQIEQELLEEMYSV